MDKLIDNIKKNVSIAKNEAEKFTKVVIDKTTNIVDITKLTLAKNDAEGKVTRLYEQIGEIVWDKHNDGTDFDGKIGELCVEIDKFKSELEELKKQISGLKNTSICSACGQSNDKSSEYCSKCGSRLSDDETETVTPDEIIDVVPED